MANDSTVETGVPSINVCFCEQTILNGAVGRLRNYGCPVHGVNVAQEALVRLPETSKAMNGLAAACHAHRGGCQCGTRRGHERRFKRDKNPATGTLLIGFAEPREVFCEWEMVPDTDRCCYRCNHVNVDKRHCRHVDALMCFECRPPTGYERLEKLRGKPYGVGESPDADVFALLDDLEATKKQLKDIVEKFDAQPIASREHLAKSLFVAANIDEVMRRAELDETDLELAGPIHMSVRAHEVVPIMWNDPHYKRSRDECEKAAERVWLARRCCK